MMNSSFMYVHHVVCHLDLNEMKTDKVSTLSLRWLYQLNLKHLSFWSSFTPWNLEWMFLLYLSHLISHLLHSSLLSMFCLCLSLCLSVFCYDFDLYFRLVIYHMPGNNATLRIDFTDLLRKWNLVRSLFETVFRNYTPVMNKRWTDSN